MFLACFLHFKENMYTYFGERKREKRNRNVYKSAAEKTNVIFRTVLTTFVSILIIEKCRLEYININMI